MSKRVGHVYEQMAVWEHIVDAENTCVSRKLNNFGVRMHVKHRWSNLIEIQENVLSGNMRTGMYMHEQRVSGQDKLRDISKLKFHPSHIQHQLLASTADRRVDKALIRHTYASRKGYGQIKAALQIEKNLRKYRGEYLWYGQGDVVKYYDNMPHEVVRRNMCRMFKDDRFISAFMEPFETFSGTGHSVPLGIRPSQSAGNIALMTLDRYATEEVKCKCYLRYLDDFMFLGHTKGEVKYKMKRLKAFVESIGFQLHEPKIHLIRNRLDMLGFVYDDTRNDMYWRKSNKRRWLSHRSRVTNPRRIRELDDAAWGMLKWGNKHCQRLFELKTGIHRETERMKNMGVRIENSGFKRSERKDANGVPFIDAPKITMAMLLNKPVEICQVVRNVRTSQGAGRYAVKVIFMGEPYKLIVNAVGIKSFLDDMERQNVTKVKTTFVDMGALHYDIDLSRTEILEVDGKAIEEKDGKVVFAGTDETVNFD